MKQLIKAHNHKFFWIQGGMLYETYQTVRGPRYRFIMEAPGEKDCDQLTKGQVEEIEKKY